MNKKQLKSWSKNLFRWIRILIATLFIFSLLQALLFKFIPVHFPTHLIYRQLAPSPIDETDEICHQWVPLSEISQNLIQAVVASEDNLFWIHYGFEFKYPETIPNENAPTTYIHPSKTISRQTARTVFLFPTENTLNNLLETYYTALIEFVWGKERIMEVYLNSTEMSPNTFGAEAVAQSEFQVSAAELNASQAALIAVSLADPHEFRLDNPTMYMLRRQAKIIGLIETARPIELGKTVKNDSDND